MFLSVYRFDAEPAAVLAAYDRLLRQLPAHNLQLHVCVRTARGIEVHDACSSEQVFRDFSASAAFHRAVQRAGLPPPAIEPHGEVYAAYADGHALVAARAHQAGMPK